MFTELIDLFTLLATLPNRGVVLTEAALVIVAFLFALELAAPLIALVGFVLKASALPRVRLGASRALPRPPGAKWARAPIAAAATAGWPAPDEANRVLPKSSDPGASPFAPGSIDELVRVIGEAQPWRDPSDRP
jgi:hypothetical protein